MIDDRAEAHRLDQRCGRRPCALENIGDAQRQLARLERLRQIIIGADFQAFDAVLGLVEVVRMLCAKSKPLPPGIITSRMSRSNFSPASLARASAAVSAVETR